MAEKDHGRRKNFCIRTLSIIWKISCYRNSYYFVLCEILTNRNRPYACVHVYTCNNDDAISIRIDDDDKCDTYLKFYFPCWVEVLIRIVSICFSVRFIYAPWLHRYNFIVVEKIAIFQLILYLLILPTYWTYWWRDKSLFQKQYIPVLGSRFWSFWCPYIRTFKYKHECNFFRWVILYYSKSLALMVIVIHPSNLHFYTITNISNPV